MNALAANVAFVNVPSIGASNLKENTAYSQKEPDYAGYVRESRPKIEKLTQLPKGWDGPSSIAVKPDIADFALTVLKHIYVDELPVPFFAPGGDGSLQMEWHERGYDIELDIKKPCLIEAWRKNIVTDKEEEKEITNDFQVIIDWMHSLMHASPSK